MPDDAKLIKIRRRYSSMVNIRNNAGAPSEVECDIRDLLAMIDHPRPDTAPGLRNASYFLKEAAASCFMEHKDEIAGALRDFSDQLLIMASKPSDSGPIPITDLPDPLGADA